MVFLLGQIYMLSEQDDWWGTKAFPGIVSAIVSTQKLNTSEYWRLLQHEIYMGARFLFVMQWHIVIHVYYWLAKLLASYSMIRSI